MITGNKDNGLPEALAKVPHARYATAREELRLAFGLSENNHGHFYRLLSGRARLTPRQRAAARAVLGRYGIRF